MMYEMHHPKVVQVGRI